MLRPHEHERQPALAGELLDEALELVLMGDRDERVLHLAALQLGGQPCPHVRGGDGVGARQLATAPSKVAEKSIVCRFAGTVRRIGRPAA